MTPRLRRRGARAAWLACAAAGCLTSIVGAQTAPQKPPQKQPRAAREAAAPAAPAAAAATDYARRFESTCAPCHGPGGRSVLPDAPVLAGQHSFYAITQLFLFREGRRDNAAMTAVAKGMSDADMRGFSDHIGTLPPAPAAAASAPADPQRMALGRELAHKYKCDFCHGSDFAGGQQVPRIGGQHEGYLRDTLHGFHSGKRPAYTKAMLGALAGVSADEIDTLAYYAARLPAAAASAPGR